MTAYPSATIDRICLTVPDLDRAEAFYREALGFAAAGPASRCDSDRAALLGVPHAVISAVALQLGAQVVELLAFDPPGRPYPDDSTSSDLWFQHCAIVVRDPVAAVVQLEHFGIRPITRGDPQHLPPAAGSVTAYKFRDPFGHPLELLSFPDGTGDPAWHADAVSGSNFLGIDHTAIAVSDAARSARFYENAVGFRVTAQGVNKGQEQDRLDNIQHDRVDVVALAPSRQPPHLELLGYHAGSRRPRPGDWAPSAVAVTRTIVMVDDIHLIEVHLGAATSARRGSWDGHPAMIFADPDGHELIVRERS